MGASFTAQNGSKRSVTIDLKHPEGAALFLRMAEFADVVVENFRPGVIDKLGLGYEQLRRVNDRLIYCAISGFGQDGPLASRPAYDHVVQGMAGGMSISGDAATGPVKAGFQWCDTAAATMAAFAITSALHRRAQTGQGALLDASMLDTARFTIGWPLAHFLASGEPPQPMGNHNPTGCPTGTFPTRDGMLNLVTNTQAQFLSLADVLGRKEWLADPRFATPSARPAHRVAMTEVLEPELAQRSAQTWEGVFAAAHVPACRVRSIPEILSDPQVTGRGFVHAFDEIPLAVPTPGFRADGAPLAPATPPQLGSDADALLHELGMSGPAIKALRASRAI